LIHQNERIRAENATLQGDCDPWENLNRFLVNARFEYKSISLLISSTPNRSKKAAEDYF